MIAAAWEEGTVDIVARMTGGLSSPQIPCIMKDDLSFGVAKTRTGVFMEALFGKVGAQDSSS